MQMEEVYVSPPELEDIPDPDEISLLTWKQYAAAHGISGDQETINEEETSEIEEKPHPSCYANRKAFDDEKNGARQAPIFDSELDELFERTGSDEELDLGKGYKDGQESFSSSLGSEDMFGDSTIEPHCEVEEKEGAEPVPPARDTRTSLEHEKTPKKRKRLKRASKRVPSKKDQPGNASFSITHAIPDDVSLSQVVTSTPNNGVSLDFFLQCVMNFERQTKLNSQQSKKQKVDANKVRIPQNSKKPVSSTGRDSATNVRVTNKRKAQRKLDLQIKNKTKVDVSNMNLKTSNQPLVSTADNFISKTCVEKKQEILISVQKADIDDIFDEMLSKLLTGDHWKPKIASSNSTTKTSEERKQEVLVSEQKADIDDISDEMLSELLTDDDWTVSCMTDGTGQKPEIASNNSTTKTSEERKQEVLVSEQKADIDDISDEMLSELLTDDDWTVSCMTDGTGQKPEIASNNSTTKTSEEKEQEVLVSEQKADIDDISDEMLSELLTDDDWTVSCMTDGTGQKPEIASNNSTTKTSEEKKQEVLVLEQKADIDDISDEMLSELLTDDDWTVSYMTDGTGEKLQIAQNDLAFDSSVTDDMFMDDGWTQMCTVYTTTENLMNKPTPMTKHDLAPRRKDSLSSGQALMTDFISAKSVSSTRPNESKSLFVPSSSGNSSNASKFSCQLQNCKFLKNVSDSTFETTKNQSKTYPFAPVLTCVGQSPYFPRRSSIVDSTADSNPIFRPATSLLLNGVSDAKFSSAPKHQAPCVQSSIPRPVFNTTSHKFSPNFRTRFATSSSAERYHFKSKSATVTPKTCQNPRISPKRSFSAKNDKEWQKESLRVFNAKRKPDPERDYFMKLKRTAGIIDHAAVREEFQNATANKTRQPSAVKCTPAEIKRKRLLALQRKKKQNLKV